jgi:transcriptional regulator with XRE-family HTH domain
MRLLWRASPAPNGAAPGLSGMTQQALARRLKKPQSFVAKYEGGERRLDVVEFIRIARALDADPLKLLAAFLGHARGKALRAKAGSKRDT